MNFYDMFCIYDPYKTKEDKKVVEMMPTRCEGCIFLRHRMDGDVRVMDQCFVYDRQITDEMLKEPCKFYMQRVKE